MRKILFLSILWCIIISCSSDSNESVSEEAPDIMDQNPPEITLSSLPDIIEVTAILEIRITDESNTTTTITVNGETVDTSSEKTLTFSIDPFAYSSGNNTLVVQTTDNAGNVNSSTIDFETKRLLFSYPDLTYDYNSDTIDAYLAVNNNNGDLVTSFKVEAGVPGKIYADDSFERQSFTITNYYVSTSEFFTLHVINSNSDLEPGTRILSGDERRALFNWGFALSRNQSTDVVIDTPNRAFMNGYNAFLTKNSSDINDKNYRILHSDDESSDFAFLYVTPEDGNIDNYSYLPVEDFTKSNYSSADFLTPSATQQYQIPNGIEASLEIQGYNTLEDYENHRFKDVYSARGIDAAGGKSIEIPTFDHLFDTYQTVLTHQLDDRISLNIHQRGLDSPTLKPWNISESGDEISFSGEYDYSRFTIIKNGIPVAPSTLNFFVWNVFQRPSSSRVIPFKTFEIPEEILAIYSERGINLDPESSNPDTYAVTMTQHEKEIDYTALLFDGGYFFNEAGDRYSMTLNLKR